MPVAPTESARLLLELSRSTGAEWGAWIRNVCAFEAETLSVERVSFWNLDEQASSMSCDAGFVATNRTFEHGARLSLRDVPEYFEAVREARALAVAEVREDSRLHGLADYCSARGITAVLDVPVWAEGRLRGVLCHEHVGSARRWTPAEEDFAVGVGQVVACALAARAHTLAEDAARRASFLDAVARGVLSSLDAGEIARRALALLVPRLADAGLVWATTRDGALACIGAAHADPRKQSIVDDYLREMAETGEAPHFAARVMRERQSLLLPDVSPAHIELHEVRDAQRRFVRNLGLSTGIGVPLAVGDRVIGAMALLGAGRHYDSNDQCLAEEIACRVASGLENARAYEVAREAIRARDDFLLLVGHELLTPLTALQLMTDDLVRRASAAGSPEEARRSEAIVAQVRRFRGVVDHVLQASSIRAEGVTLAVATCDLAAVVESAVSAVADRAQRAKSLVRVGQLDAVPGRFDAAHLERVVGILLDNAVKFGEGKPVDVSLRRDGTWAELTVRDRGIGIAPDRLTAIFSPFERAVAKEHFGGLGMGLYVAGAIVEAHGGSITANSCLGDGTTMVVRIPTG